MEKEQIYIGHRHEWGGDTPFGIDAPARRQHVYVIGQTGAGIHTQTLVEFAVHDVPERFTIRSRHSANLVFDVVEHLLHGELLRLTVHRFVGLEWITVILFPFQVWENLFEDFVVESPLEPLFTHPGKERRIADHNSPFGWRLKKPITSV